MKRAELVLRRTLTGNLSSFLALQQKVHSALLYVMSRPGLNNSLREVDVQLKMEGPGTGPCQHWGVGRLQGSVFWEALAVAAPVLQALGGCLQATAPWLGCWHSLSSSPSQQGHGLMDSLAQHPAARAGWPPRSWTPGSPCSVPSSTARGLTGHRSARMGASRVGGGLCRGGPTPCLLLVLRPVGALPRGSSEKTGREAGALGTATGRGVSRPSPTDTVSLSLAPTGLSARGFHFTGNSRGSVKCRFQCQQGPGDRGRVAGGPQRPGCPGPRPSGRSGAASPHETAEKSAPGPWRLRAGSPWFLVCVF